MPPERACVAVVLGLREGVRLRDVEPVALEDSEAEAELEGLRPEQESEWVAEPEALPVLEEELEREAERLLERDALLEAEGEVLSVSVLVTRLVPLGALESDMLANNVAEGVRDCDLASV